MPQLRESVSFSFSLNSRGRVRWTVLVERYRYRLTFKRVVEHFSVIPLCYCRVGLSGLVVLVTGQEIPRRFRDTKAIHYETKDNSY